MNIDEAARVFTDPKAYADEKRFHAACARLRRESPVTRVEVEGFDPFWAVTKHDDVMEIARQPDRWLNAPRPALGPKPRDATARATCRSGRSCRWTRRITPCTGTSAPTGSSRRASPGSATARPSWRSATSIGWRSSTVSATSSPTSPCTTRCTSSSRCSAFPRRISRGCSSSPRSCSGRSTRSSGAGPDQDDLLATLLDFFEYFQKLTEDRRANPTDDLASVIANAEIDGEADRHAGSGGLLRPDRDRRPRHHELRDRRRAARADRASGSAPAAARRSVARPDRGRGDDPLGLAGEAVHAHRHRRLRPARRHDPGGGVGAALVPVGQPRRGRLRRAPDVLDVGRDPNPHVGFGFGAHFCLGTHLARLEARALYNELLPRLRSVELAGEPAYMETLFVGGPKHLPIRYELT